MTAVLTLLSLVAGLVIEGETDCPSTAEVASALRPLLAEEFAAPDRQIHVSVQAEQLALSLTSHDGTVLAERRLPRKGSCEFQAHQVAVVAAAWQADLSDEPLPPPPRIVPEEEPEAQLIAPAYVSAPSLRHTVRLEMGLRILRTAGFGPGFQMELGVGKRWGRWGVLGTVAGPAPVVMVGPTFTLVDGYPTIYLRAQGAVTMDSGDNGLIANPGLEGGVRVSMGDLGPRGYVDLAFAHYFASTGSVTNQGVLTLGIALGGP
jgi:hypothetical protein